MLLFIYLTHKFVYRASIVRVNKIKNVWLYRNTGNLLDYIQGESAINSTIIGNEGQLEII
jgi:hypothetical protein